MTAISLLICFENKSREKKNRNNRKYAWTVAAVLEKAAHYELKIECEL